MLNGSGGFALVLPVSMAALEINEGTEKAGNLNKNVLKSHRD
jgi:hypothetical protein